MTPPCLLSKSFFALSCLLIELSVSSFQPSTMPIGSAGYLSRCENDRVHNMKYGVGQHSRDAVPDVMMHPDQKHKLAEDPMKEPHVQETRRLGSMEAFMLPRPIGPDTANNEYQRPPMNHIVAFVLSSTPSIHALRVALDNAVCTHPLLRARVIGDGHPKRWLDPVRRMVRWNGWDNNEEDNPLEFVVYSPDCEKGIQADEDEDFIKSWTPPNYWGGSLHIVNVKGKTRHDLDKSWQLQFEQDLDSGTVVSMPSDLWKLELHKLGKNDMPTKSNEADASMPGTPCVLLLTMNHAISDQGSVNLVFDQILSDIAELEEAESSGAADGIIQNPTLVQPLPSSITESVLGGSTSSSQGSSTRLTILDIIKSPFYPSSIKGIMSYAMHQLKGDSKLPTLFPSHKPGIMDILDQMSILLFGSSLRKAEDDISHRRSNVEYRTLPAEVTSGLVKRSKAHRVPISMTLAAAVAATCSDTFGTEHQIHINGQQSRAYKILQSLDTRRFHGVTDPGDTLSCQAGGMDLILPVPDGIGMKIRKNAASQTENEMKRQAQEQFWAIAKQSYDQTSSFLKGAGGCSVESVRMFDLGMHICDIGRLVEVYANSDVTKGRAWSAGITNVGEYERQKAVSREGVSERGNLKMHENYRLEEIYMCTSHSRIGATFPVNCITIGGEMSITINPPWPLISKAKSEEFADAFVQLLDVIATKET